MAGGEESSMKGELAVLDGWCIMALKHLVCCCHTGARQRQGDTVESMS